MNSKFHIGDLVSAKVWEVSKPMPGVGEIISIALLGMKKNGKNQYLYTCEHNGRKYTYSEEEIYLFDPY